MNAEADAAIALLHETIARHQQDRDQRIDPRLVAAEAVAACALHLTQQWSAWQALNAVALAAISDPAAPSELASDLLQLGRDKAGAMAALAAYELLDAAVRVWAPHAHPAIALHAIDPSAEPDQPL